MTTTEFEAALTNKKFNIGKDTRWEFKHGALKINGGLVAQYSIYESDNKVYLRFSPQLTSDGDFLLTVLKDNPVKIVLEPVYAKEKVIILE